MKMHTVEAKNEEEGRVCLISFFSCKNAIPFLLVFLFFIITTITSLSHSSVCFFTSSVLLPLRLHLNMMNIHVESAPRKMEECRICHDGDDDSNMEIPCSCRGTLKYAHRKCVQRWCNEKGDIICEICRQNFTPDYTAPAPLFGRFPMNMRGNWDISMDEVDYPHFAALISADHNFIDYESDEYSTFYPRSLMCCRIVAITFVLLLMLRTMLPIIFGVAGDNSVTLVMLSVAKVIGILLAVYVLVKAFIAVRHRRHQQELHHRQIAPSDEENELPLQQHQHYSQMAPLNDENELPVQHPPQPHFIHVQ